MVAHVYWLRIPCCVILFSHSIHFHGLFSLRLFPLPCPDLSLWSIWLPIFVADYHPLLLRQAGKCLQMIVVPCRSPTHPSSFIFFCPRSLCTPGVSPGVSPARLLIHAAALLVEQLVIGWHKGIGGAYTRACISARLSDLRLSAQPDTLVRSQCGSCLQISIVFHPRGWYRSEHHRHQWYRWLGVTQCRCCPCAPVTVFYYYCCCRC